jgi:hypothetical protein
VSNYRKRRQLGHAKVRLSNAVDLPSKTQKEELTKRKATQGTMLEREDVSAKTEPTEGERKMADKGTDTADNARKTLQSAGESLKQGSEQAKQSMEREAEELTDALGRLTEIGTEYIRRTAELSIDAFQKMATEMLNLQSKTAEWIRGTPFAAIYEAQAQAGRKLIEITASNSRQAWQTESDR